MYKTHLDLRASALEKCKNIKHKKIQTLQNISLKKITNTPPLVLNPTLHNEFKITTLDESYFS